MAEGGRRKNTENTRGNGGRGFSWRLENGEWILNKKVSRQDAVSTIVIPSAPPREPIYEFANHADETDEVASQSDIREPIYEVLPDLYDTARNMQRLTLSEELQTLPDAIVRAEKLIKNSKFEKAISLVTDHSPTQRQQLMMSECYFQLGRMRSAFECINTLDALIKSHNLTPDDVMEIIDEYIFAKSYIRAMVLLSCSSRLYKFNSNPNKRVDGIRKCLRKCGWKVISAMLKGGKRLRAIAIEVGLEIINDMLTELRSMTGADSDRKAVNESICLLIIANCYHEIRKYNKAIDLLQQGIDVMTKEFGSNALKHVSFGVMLINIGNSLLLQCDYSAAYAYYTQALGVYNIARDWKNNEQKQEYIDRTKRYQLDAENQIKNNNIG